MLNTTLSFIRCPKQKCQGEFKLISNDTYEIRSGTLNCKKCNSKFLIISGIALLVNDTREYIINHVKGISKLVQDHEIPKEYLSLYKKVKDEVVSQHIEEDLESERVTSLYFMNHYLRVNSAETTWWKPLSGTVSPVIDSIVKTYWNHGPFEEINKMISDVANKINVVELGCGVGGLHLTIKPYTGFYLGIDNSFASIALARHIALGVAYNSLIKVPEDLLHGHVSREINFPISKNFDGKVDFVVADFENPPLANNQWDLSIALNSIDMLDNPATLPRLQYTHLKPGGSTIQSCPYIWHEKVAKNLKKILPSHIDDSASAVEWLYQQAGFKITEKKEHIPWLFFKHVRQLEIYSVHMFKAWKSTKVV